MGLLLVYGNCEEANAFRRTTKTRGLDLYRIYKFRRFLLNFMGFNLYFFNPPPNGQSANKRIPYKVLLKGGGAQGFF